MPIQRMTAKKVRIYDVINGKWVKKEGMEPSYIETSYGDQLSRVRIMGTIVSKFLAEDGNFASITVDDATDTIRAKTFKTVKPLDAAEVGDIVDVVGKVREYNEEIYIIPEIVLKIRNPNMELLRKLEIMTQLKKHGSIKQKVVASAPAPEEQEEKVEPAEKEDLRKKVLEKIEASVEGISYSEVIGGMSAPEEEVESVINDLLAEGICYEPTPGKIRKI